MYAFFRRLFFLLDAERAHYLAMGILKSLCSIPLFQKGLSRMLAARSLPVRQFGLLFKNPIGLGAGFDKNAAYLRELETLGFGFVEIGTVTPKPQAGNDKPRLFRLPQDLALINRMGFNNDGADVIAERLKNWRADTKNTTLRVGGNIGKNKTTPNEDAWKDYETCFTALHPYVDFFVVNVSSPNTPGLRALQEKDSLRQILTHLQGLNKQQLFQKPILLKIAPDLTLPQLDDVIQLASEIGLDGLVATNTTISRDGLTTPTSELEAIGTGGLSGKPLQQAATEMVQYITTKTGGALPIIGSGGIFKAQDAAQKRASGAVLLEVWTGFIYEGPAIVKKLCKGLNP
ncbi:MAG TPA: quinone-dependent dihydroorotate dehydrogenase [Chitinophagaceae bacterium]|nr:quinone-dependent dihydroorotate dehydrogenase [Chitinophagaceae bacterium]